MEKRSYSQNVIGGQEELLSWLKTQGKASKGAKIFIWTKFERQGREK